MDDGLKRISERLGRADYGVARTEQHLIDYRYSLSTSEHEDLLEIFSFSELAALSDLKIAYNAVNGDDVHTRTRACLELLESPDIRIQTTAASALLYIALGYPDEQLEVEDMRVSVPACVALAQEGAIAVCFDALVAVIQHQSNSTAGAVAEGSPARATSPAADSPQQRLHCRLMNALCNVLCVTLEAFVTDRANEAQSPMSDAERQTYTECRTALMYFFETHHAWTGSRYLPLLLLLHFIHDAATDAIHVLPTRKISILALKVARVTLGGLDQIEVNKSIIRKLCGLDALDAEPAKDMGERTASLSNVPPAKAHLSDIQALQEQIEQRFYGYVDDEGKIGPPPAVLEAMKVLKSRLHVSHSILQAQRLEQLASDEWLKLQQEMWRHEDDPAGADAASSAADDAGPQSLRPASKNSFALKMIFESSMRLDDRFTFSNRREDLQRAWQEQLSRRVQTETTLCQVEQLYNEMSDNMSHFVLGLLRVMLAAAPPASAEARNKASQPQNRLFRCELQSDSDSLPRGSTLQALAFKGVDELRIKEIALSATTTLLLLLLRHFKASHIAKFLHLSKAICDARGIPLLLKLLNHDIPSYIVAATDLEAWQDLARSEPGGSPQSRSKLNAPDLGTLSLSDDDDEEGETAPQVHKALGRNARAMVNAACMLQKLTKNRPARVLLLVMEKAALVLRKALVAQCSPLVTYLLKVQKSMAPFMGRAWRSRNIRNLLSSIDQAVRQRIGDRWFYEVLAGSQSSDYEEDEQRNAETIDKYQQVFFSWQRETTHIQRLVECHSLLDAPWRDIDVIASNVP